MPRRALRWNRMSVSVAALCLVVSAPAIAHEPETKADGSEPLNVFLSARTVGEPLSKAEKEAREDELERTKKETKKARKALDKKLKAEHGKDRDEWPDDQWEAYRLAMEAESMAHFEHNYLRSGAAAKGKQKDLNDSRQDIQEAIEGKSWSREQGEISLVKSSNDAELLVEVFDRASFRFGDHKVIVVKISPAVSQRSPELADISPDDSDRRIVVRHHYRDEEPFWLVEVAEFGNMWRNNAALVAGVLTRFIQENRGALANE